MRTRLICLILLTSNLCFSQWTKLNSGTDASLRGVSAPGIGVCWASGSKGTVLLTTDGGSHWKKLPVPDAEKLDFRDIEAFDESTAVIMSAGPAEQGQARIFKTTDAGAHWKEVFSTNRTGIFLDSMAFWDAKRGIVFSDPVNGEFILFTTEDGGDHWKQLQPRSMPPALANEGAFAASGTAIAVAGHHDVWFGTGGASVSRIFHSPDGGKHWWVSETPIAAGKASAGVFGLAFKDRDHGVAVGGDYTMQKGEVTAIATTSDGGKTWTAQKSALPPLEGVATVDQGSYFAVGNAYAENPGSGEWYVDHKISGNAIAVVRDTRFLSIYVVGPKGAIYLNRAKR